MRDSAVRGLLQEREHRRDSRVQQRPGRARSKNIRRVS